MSKKTTIVLGVVAAGLLAFILLYERHTISTGDVEGRRRQLLPELVRDQVRRIELRRTDGVVALERGDAADEGDLPEWTLVEPVRDGVDADAIEALLGELEWATPRRALGPPSEDDLERFGLASPAITARVRVADRWVVLTLGGEDPQGAGRYARVGEGDVQIVGRDFFEALDHGPDHFRDKELFGALRVERATELVVTGTQGDFRALERDGRWWVVEPVEAWAAESKVRELLGDLAGLRARRFVDERPADLARYGLGRGARQVRVVREREETPAEPGLQEASLRIGGPCDGHADEVHARVDEGPVVCVLARELERLATSPQEMRELRLTTLASEELERLELSAGARALTLRREGEGFVLEGGAEGAPADADAVAAFLRALRSQVATEVIGPDTGSPLATLTLRREGEGPADVLALLGVAPAGVRVRRGEEPTALLFAAQVEALLTPTELAFRSRRVVEESATDADRVQVTGPGLREVAERGAGGWSLSHPVTAAADAPAVRALVSELAGLRTERWVAVRAGPEHGLSSPRLTVAVRFEVPQDDDAHDDEHDDHDHEGEGAGDPGAPAAPREHRVEIGAPTAGGAFARLGGSGAVFVASQALVDAASVRLASRGLLAVDASAVEALTVTRAGESLRLERAEGGLRRAEGALALSVEPRALLDRLSTLRARAISGYGPRAGAEALSPPRAVVVIERAEGEPRTLTLRFFASAAGHPSAAELPASEGAGASPEVLVHARRDDLEIGFLVAEEDVRPLLR